MTDTNVTSIPEKQYDTLGRVAHRGGNQDGTDLRQQKFRAYYTDPKSVSFNQLSKSAKRAGYTDSSSRQLYKAAWLQKLMSGNKLLKKAEKNLDEFLTMEHYDVDRNRYHVAALQVKADITKFVAGAYDPRTYNTRPVNTDEDNNAQQQPIIQINNTIFNKYGQ